MSQARVVNEVPVPDLGRLHKVQHPPEQCAPLNFIFAFLYVYLATVQPLDVPGYQALNITG